MTKIALDGMPGDICSTCGNPMAEHSVRHPGHKGVAAPRGGKTLCPHGSYEHTHNVKDKYQLVQFWCIWNQVFDADADKTPITHESWEIATDWMRSRPTSWGPDKPMKLASSPTKSYASRVLGEKPAAAPTTVAAALREMRKPTPPPTELSSMAAELEAMERRRIEAEEAERKAAAPVDAKAARRAKAKKALAGIGTVR